MSFAHLNEESAGGAASRRRRRPVASAVAGTAIVAAAFGLAAANASSANATVDAPATARAAAPAVVQHTTASVPPVVRMKPGTLAIGGGYSVTLTKDSVTLADAVGDQVGPKSTDDGNQAPDSVSMQIVGRAVGGLYIGAGTAASATVTVDGTVHQATVVTLYGRPGWSEVCVVLPAAPDAQSTITTSVYDRAGHVLASYTNPGMPA